MRILISAYACEPDRGSEPGVGWNIVRELSKNHQLTVLTRANNEKVILGCGEEWVRHVQWEWIDPPEWLTFWKKKGRGLQLFYLLWQEAAFRRAKKLIATGEKFDLSHHVTFGKYWVPSPLANLEIPFIFGPVGGGEETPPSLDSGYSVKGKISERIRALFQKAVGFFPPLRARYQKAAWTLAATPQTEEKLRTLGVGPLSVLPQSGIGDDESSLMESSDLHFPGRKSLTLITACRLIHWKAVDLAIEAAAVALKNGVKLELIVLQEGPEMDRLKGLVEQLGIQNAVHFLGRLPCLGDVYDQIKKADALVHPALHEAFGQSCLESLIMGTPVICLDWGGPGMIVNDQTGWKVVPETRQQTIDQLALAYGKAAHLSRDERAARSACCKEHALKEFTWEKLAEDIEDVYSKVITKC